MQIFKIIRLGFSCTVWIIFVNLICQSTIQIENKHIRHPHVISITLCFPRIRYHFPFWNFCFDVLVLMLCYSSFKYRVSYVFCFNSFTYFALINSNRSWSVKVTAYLLFSYAILLWLLHLCCSLSWSILNLYWSLIITKITHKNSLIYLLSEWCASSKCLRSSKLVVCLRKDRLYLNSITSA